MAYFLDSIVKFGKYNGMTVQQCIDQNMYEWGRIIDKHEDWYSHEVKNYLKESKNLVRQNKYELKKGLKFALSKDNS